MNSIRLAAIAWSTMLAVAGPATAQGSRIYVDPETGADTSAPPAAPDTATKAPETGAPQDLGDAAKTVESDPTPVANERPGGGMMLDPRGRVRADLTATIDANGDLHVDCVHGGAHDGGH